MRLGAKWRGALALLCLLGFAAGTASAGLFHKSIPREVGAVNLSTGQPYFAPPIPYGHYAKDKVGYIQDHVGMVKGKVGSLFHHGGGGGACNSCGGRGCALCSGTGLGHGASMPCADCDGAGGGGLFHGHGHGGGQGQSFVVQESGGGFHGKHHGAGRATVIEGPTYGAEQSSLCDSCGGRGCGLCKGLGRRHGGGFLGANACGSCGGKGCGLCGGRGNACGACGGKGCGLCGGRGFLAGAHGKLAGIKGAILGKLTHAGQIQYFVGPGGPVPITPGYVPYINVTRSPRDYFAFPPFADNVP